jgi:two-component system alkaline phosphatase synthesis response regulator PhoP
VWQFQQRAAEEELVTQAPFYAQSDRGQPRTPKKVLVIDDNPSIVELVKYAVCLYGDYDVVSAFDGEEGLRRFYEEQPDCVIIDVKMPRMDGYQLIRCLRGDATSAHVPLIILSAMIREEDKVQGYLSGVDEYLTKPFKPAALSAAVERVMKISVEQRYQRMRELAARYGA